jgi:importin subunit alpha-1
MMFVGGSHVHQKAEAPSSVMRPPSVEPPQPDPEHEACVEEFVATAVLAALAQDVDQTRSALPPLWPQVLHFITDLALPLGMDQDCGTSLIPRFLHAIGSTIPSHQHAGAMGIRRILSDADGSASTEVVQAGAVPLLSKLLTNDNLPQAQNEAVRSIGKMASQSSTSRALMLRNGVFDELIRILQSPGISLALRRNVMWAISNLCCSEAMIASLTFVEAAIPAAIVLTRFPDEEVAADAMWTLAHISDGSHYFHIDSVINYGALPTVIRHLPGALEVPALRILGNMVSGSDKHTTLVIEHGAIPALLTTLQGHAHDTSPLAQREILRTFSDIAGTHEQVNALLEAGVFTHIASYIISEHESIREESQWTINNAVRRASISDRTAIIGTSSFRALLTASTTDRITPVGAQALEVAFARDLDAVMAVASEEELQLVADALQENEHEDICHHGERIDEILQCEIG